MRNPATSVVLESHKAPLVFIHGGPGAASYYAVDGWGAYANKTDRPVILYDQIGCGRSSHSPDTMGNDTIWNTELFMAELNNLLLSLKIESHVLTGHSWGAIAAGSWGSYAFDGQYPARAGLKKLILTSGPARMSDWVDSVVKLVKAMGPEVSGPLLNASETGDYSSPEYLQAKDKFYREHLCRMDPWPQGLVDSFANIEEDPTVYVTMNGPDEVNVVGNLKDFDITGKCGNINVPTLLLNGEFDEAQDSVLDTWRKCITNAPVYSASVRNTSHMLHLEQPEQLTQILKGFLECP
ncbi:Alpha/Beta hydrolase protein [Coniochaeta sp. 2T2.1]|nr:Alpha/Beta hydrolase protein [Coniochaeta sp. 2T2.1]